MTAVTARPRCLGYPLKCSIFVAALLASLAPGRLSADWIIGHNGLHAAGLNDQRGPNGELAYKGAYPENTKALMDIRGTDKAAMNPDSLLDW